MKLRKGHYSDYQFITSDNKSLEGYAYSNSKSKRYRLNNKLIGYLEWYNYKRFYI